MVLVDSVRRNMHEGGRRMQQQESNTLTEAREHVREIRIPLEWYVPEELPTHYATHLVIQHTEHEFFITFFELVPPIMLSKPPEEIERIESVRARALTRVAVSPKRLEEFIQVMQDNLAKYRSSISEGAKEE
jgi:hypothetical protein